MKNLRKSGIFHVFLSLALASLFLACEKEDEPPDPSGVLPKVEFTYNSINPYDRSQYQAIDDYNAPVTVGIDFPVGYDELSTWEKVEIDFGNGIVDVYDPYNLRMGINPNIYYAGGTYQITARVTNARGTSEITKEIEILPMKELKVPYLDGIWSIMTEIVSPGSGVTIEKPRKKYQSTFSFSTFSPGTYYYGRFDMHWLEEESGTFTVDGLSINTLPEYDTSFYPMTLTVDSFYRKNNEVHLAMRTLIEDDDVGQILYQVDFVKIDLQDPYYDFSQELDNYKWSIIEEETKIYAYSDLTLEYSDLIESTSNEIIPYNLLTLDLRDYTKLQLIDNWNDGAYERLDSYGRNRNFYRLRFGNYLSSQVVFALFDPEYKNSDPNIYSLTTSTFDEVNGERVRVETKNKIRLNNGSEATIDKDSLIGSWEIVDKAETINGNLVDPGNSDTPPIGTVLTYNSDGSADLGGGAGESWFMLDESNIVIVTTGGEEILIHLNNYDDAEGKMEIMSISHDTEDDYKLIFNLVKL